MSALLEEGEYDEEQELECGSRCGLEKFIVE